MRVINRITTSLLLFGFIVALLAPFTFLKPKPIITSDKEVTNKSQQESSETKPVKVVKKPEKPLHSVALPDFAKIYDIPTKKQRFFDFLRPTIIKHNQELLITRAKLEYWMEQTSLELGLTDSEQIELALLAKQYRVSKQSSTLQKLDELLVKIDIIPESLVLVQAANESAWGTSRFARIGLNFFGIWCYKPKCGMVPNGRNEGAKHEVAAFQSVDDAVNGYFRNINTHNAYRVFRSIRSQLREHNQPLDAEILATGLLPYSERGAHYVLDITDMLRHNQRYFTVETATVNTGD
ncbi:glucosaminidase domain-containing protein [Litorilituus lipolyticus]|uniref:Glucosaminidase n=1 Tax=Litorilituus lipolyticus TaxID=2491017 RepID=A0A502L093_9GAMM|nr:glucosaminidase domain-containing protein [Litorilituus lipolyticus]TPH15895.1 glucosaminidase [Litorilituus lipolyticus]